MDYLRRVLLVSIGFLFALQVWGANQEEDILFSLDPGYDWLQLTSGEWLKGDFKVLYNFDVEFDSKKLDLLTIDISDVEQLIIREPQTVRLRKKWGVSNETLINGQLVIRGDQATIQSENGEKHFKRSDIIAVVDGTEHQKRYWSGSVSIGANVRGGNSETLDATCSASLKRRTAISRFTTSYTGNFSEARSDETANNHRLNGTADRFITSEFFWRIIGGEYYRDPFSNIDSQYGVGTGLGYALINTAKIEWEFSAGVGYQYQRFVSTLGNDSETVSSPFLIAGSQFDMEVTDSIDYLFNYSLQLLNERSGTYTHHFKTTLSTDFIENFDTDISLVWDHVQTPQQAADGSTPKQNDYQLIFSLAHDF